MSSPKVDRPAPRQPQPRAGWLPRVALALGSVVVLAVVLELLLQLAALGVGGSERGGGGFGSSAVRILTLGDSNTFGLYVDEEEAYPAALESLWNATVDGPPVDVLNFGYPGTNSSGLLGNLPRMLGTFEPDVVVVLIGTNDYWTTPFEVEPEAGFGVAGWLRDHSRLYKLVYMAWQGLRAPAAVEVEYDREAYRTPDGDARHTGLVRYGDEEFRITPPLEAFTQESPDLLPDDEMHAALVRNLTEMVELCREADVGLVLLSYPSHRMFYELANRRIRQVAQRTGTPFVDLEREFARRCPSGSCPDLFFEDQHVTVEGYRIIAERLRAALEPILLEEASGPAGD